MTRTPKERLYSSFSENKNSFAGKEIFSENPEAALHGILLVEDNDFIRSKLKKGLEVHGYKIFEAPDAHSARKILRENEVDLILLDIGLPDGNGLDLVPEIRNSTNAPIIIISGNDKMTDKIKGLEMGADDYLCKPVHMEELWAHVKANIRRYKTANAETKFEWRAEDTKIKFGKWILDCSRYQIFDEMGQEGVLTVKEFQLLEALVKSAGRTLTREQLFMIVRDENSEATDRAVDVQIAHIRKKIGDCKKSSPIIKTIRGIGYMFDAVISLS